MASNEVILKFLVDTKYAQKAVKDFSDKAQKRLENVSNIGKNIAVGAGAAFAGLSAGIAASVTTFAKFENQIRSVKTLLNESSFADVGKSLNDGFKDLEKDTLNVFKQMPIDLDAASKSMFDLVSAGIPASKAAKALGSAAKLAVAGITDVSVATDGLTSALNAYGIDAERADEVAGKFFLAQKAGKTTIEELSTGFGLVGATAQAMNVSFEEVVSSVAAMTTAGIKTNSAYTGLNAVFANVAKPTKEAADEAKRLGIEFNAAALRSKGLAGFLNQLSTNSKFTKDSVTKLFGSVEAQKVAFSLTGKQLQTFNATLKEVGNTETALSAIQNAYNEQSNTFSNQTMILKNQMLALSISIGKSLAPAMSALVKIVTKIVAWFSSFSDSTKSFIAISLLVVTAITGIATAVGGFLAFIPSMIAGFAAIINGLIAVKGAVVTLTTFMLANPIILIISGIVAAVTGLFFAWRNNFLGIQEITFGVFGAIRKLYENFISIFSTGFSGLGEIIKGALTGDLDAIKKGITDVKTFLNKDVLDGVTQAYKDSSAARKEELDKQVKLEKEAAEKIKQNTIKITSDTAKQANENIDKALGATNAGLDKKEPPKPAVELKEKAGSKKEQETMAQAFAKEMSEGLKGFFSPLTTIVDAIGPIISTAQGLVDAIPDLLGSVAKLITSITELPLELVKNIGAIFDAITGLIGDLIANIINSFTDLLIKTVEFLFKGLPGAFAKAAKTIPEAIKRLFAELPRLMTEAGLGIILAIPEIVTSFIDALAKTDWGAVVARLVESIPLIVTSLVDALIIGGGIERIVTSLITQAPRIAYALSVGLIQGVLQSALGIGKRIAAGIISINIGASISKNIKIPSPKISFPKFRWPSYPRFKWPSYPQFKWPSIPEPDWVKKLKKIGNLGGGGGGIIGGIAGAAQSVGEAFGFAGGGIVPMGYPNDTYPASLSSGELVVPSDTTGKLFSLIDRLSRNESGGGGAGQNLTVNIKVGEKDLAAVLLNLNRQGFRTA